MGPLYIDCYGVFISVLSSFLYKQFTASALSLNGEALTFDDNKAASDVWVTIAGPKEILGTKFPSITLQLVFLLIKRGSAVEV